MLDRDARRNRMAATAAILALVLAAYSVSGTVAEERLRLAPPQAAVQDASIVKAAGGAGRPCRCPPKPVMPNHRGVLGNNPDAQAPSGVKLLTPGASGPGIDLTDTHPLLNGALVSSTGWPFVLLDHFAPRPDRLANLWVVHTRGCPQTMGTNPWRCLHVLRFNACGKLVESDLDELLAQTLGRPVIIQVQGDLTTPDLAVGGLLWTHSWLDCHGVLPQDAVLIAFDWPSERMFRNEFRDTNEKCRRAFIAGYHLAELLTAFPPESRVCLLGQSYGGRVIAAALHLFAGGELRSRAFKPKVRLPGPRPALRIRAVAIAAAIDHHWLDPGERLGRTLAGCEAFLNLYNHRDEILLFYPILTTSEHRRALGRVGLLTRDYRRLGPRAAAYVQRDIYPQVGREHTLLGAIADAQIAAWIAPYIWSGDGSACRAEPASR